MRLRDLAGLIVIDFIDMEDRRNNAAVEKRLKEKLKSDRARIQVGRISPFGLLEMSRQRLRPGMIEATTKSCPHCHGTGRVRSDDSMALALLREIEEEGVRQRSKEVLILAPVEIANYLLNQKREHIAMIEARFGLSVRVEGDPSLISPDYRVERFKTASRVIPTPESLNLPAVAYPEPEEEEEPSEEAVEAAADEKPSGKRKRRRRRRGGRSGQERPVEGVEAVETEEMPAPAEAEVEPAELEAAEAPAAQEPEAKPKARRRSRIPRPAEEAAEAAPEPAPVPAAATPYEVIDLGEPPAPEIVEVPEANAPQRRTRERVRKPAAAVLSEVAVASVGEAVAAPAEAQAPEPEPEPAETIAEPEAAPEPAAETQAEPQPAEKPEEAPKRRGWWSRALGGS
jgi:ribonuclease E